MNLGTPPAWVLGSIWVYLLSLLMFLFACSASSKAECRQTNTHRGLRFIGENTHAHFVYIQKHMHVHGLLQYL